MHSTKFNDTFYLFSRYLILNDVQSRKRGQYIPEAIGG